MLTAGAAGVALPLCVVRGPRGRGSDEEVVEGDGESFIVEKSEQTFEGRKVYAPIFVERHAFHRLAIQPRTIRDFCPGILAILYNLKLPLQCKQIKLQREPLVTQGHSVAFKHGGYKYTP
jgi:hypothetical protein